MNTGWVAASPELVAVLAEADRVSRLSGGAFDVTVGPLVNLWGFGPGGGGDRVPPEEEVAAASARVGYAHLEVRPSPPAVRKAVPDLYVDLSAIAKGYGVDRVAGRLGELGVDARVCDHREYDFAQSRRAGFCRQITRYFVKPLAIGRIGCTTPITVSHPRRIGLIRPWLVSKESAQTPVCRSKGRTVNVAHCLVPLGQVGAYGLAPQVHCHHHRAEFVQAGRSQRRPVQTTGRLSRA